MKNRTKLPKFWGRGQIQALLKSFSSLEPSQENTHLLELQKKILTYKSRPPAAERPLCQLHCAKAGSCKCQSNEKSRAEKSREAWNYLLSLVTLPALAKMARQG